MAIQAPSGGGGGVDHSGDQFRAALRVSDIEDPELREAAAKIDGSEDCGDKWGATDGFVSADEFTDAGCSPDVDGGGDAYAGLEKLFEGDGEARAGRQEDYGKAKDALKEQEGMTDEGAVDTCSPQDGKVGAGDESDDPITDEDVRTDGETATTVESAEYFRQDGDKSTRANDIPSGEEQKKIDENAEDDRPTDEEIERRKS